MDSLSVYVSDKSAFKKLFDAKKGECKVMTDS